MQRRESSSTLNGWNKVHSVLVTGGAGFIGSHLVDCLLREGIAVTVVDNFDPYYDQAIKRANIAEHLKYKDYKLVEADVRDLDTLRRRLPNDFDVIVHLAAKTGVRPSMNDPIGYREVNVAGTQNLLELARAWRVKQFVFGSSSSVYGVNPNVPWREDANLMPVSPYASTKASAERLGRVYSHRYGIRFVALRFFTVYGPRQRPDLAVDKFSRLMLQNKPIPVFGDGSARRDYTFVDDIVEGIRATMYFDQAPFEVINLGNGQPVRLTELIKMLGEEFRVSVQVDYREEQAGDVPQTWASIDRAKALLNYEPMVSLRTGLSFFRSWVESRISTGV